MLTTEHLASHEAARTILMSVEGAIEYWAESYYINSKEQTFAVWLTQESGEEVGQGSVVVKYADIEAAILSLISNEVKVRMDIRQALVNEFALEDEGNIDAEVADVVIQVAVFGSILFG